MITPEYKIPEYDIPYYEDNTRISNSAIGWFLNKGPAYFRNMLDGKEKGLDLPQLRKGTMIHEFLLQPDQFWNDYVLFDGDKPLRAVYLALFRRYLLSFHRTFVLAHF